MWTPPSHSSTFPPFHYSTLAVFNAETQSRRGLGRWGKVSVAMGSEPMALQNVSHAKFAKYAKFDSEHWNFGLIIFPMFGNHGIHGTTAARRNRRAPSAIFVNMSAMPCIGGVIQYSPVALQHYGAPTQESQTLSAFFNQ